VQLTSDAVVFEVDGFWTPPEGLHSFEVIVRGGGGGGSTGDRSSSSWSNSNVDAEGNVNYVSGSSARNYPGAGGGGGGLTVSRGLIRAEEIVGLGPIPIMIGQGGLGATTPNATFPSFRVGNDGGDSRFGDIYIAGGGLGGGKTVQWENRTGWEYGGPGGYAPTRGGVGATYLRNDNSSLNETSTLAGGGGGGSGQGRYESDGDQYGNTTTTVYPWTKGGASGVNRPVEGNGFNVPGRPLHWEYLQSGAGGNGGGGNGGFPSGGGGGGNAEPFTGGKANGGDGAKGCVTVIEHFMIV